MKCQETNQTLGATTASNYRIFSLGALGYHCSHPEDNSLETTAVVRKSG